MNGQENGNYNIVYGLRSRGLNITENSEGESKGRNNKAHGLLWSCMLSIGMLCKGLSFQAPRI